MRRRWISHTDFWNLFLARFGWVWVIKFDEATICTQSRLWVEILVHVSWVLFSFFLSVLLLAMCLRCLRRDTRYPVARRLICGFHLNIATLIWWENIKWKIVSGAETETIKNFYFMLTWKTGYESHSFWFVPPLSASLYKRQFFVILTTYTK